ncbi:MAG: putative membrane protein [Candidatus Roizmanbacteria bacterium GW2011_GWA2_37_7]|uniref:Putative membrane protein n=1 Tax=Candidatus Roizmanbacteria bacterium GW2011_GWA2_37_7 TaxID=1618481 RepID=A0A0G0K871_9BACT|nr:MAG: putative membrane protein [Candidatus Roizmanbacteria bacterium GW2011_GWA2_37_7]
MATLPPRSSNFSHSYLVRPDIHFTSQHEDEAVVLVVRKHPLTQLSWIINGTILLLLLLVGNMIIPNFFNSNQVFAINIFGLFFIFSYIWINFLLWYFTVGVVTNERIIDLDFYNLIYKEFSATTIRQVSDITTKIGGFFGSVFNFGDVFVKTEGFAQNIEFDDIPRPSEVVKIINILMRDANPAGDEG